MENSPVKPWRWGLYDFANSLANAAVSFYFALWFIEDIGGEDYWVGFIVALSTLFLLVTLPPLGAFADRTGTHFKLLIWFSLGTVGSLALLSYVAAINTSSPFTIFLILFFYGSFQFLYQASVNFYTSLLYFVAKSSGKEEVTVSGIGLALGQLGNVIGLILALPVASAFGRPMTFLSGALFFLLFALPSFLSLRHLQTKSEGGASSTNSFGSVWRALRQRPNVLRYLFGYYLFADAVLTLQLFLSLYLSVIGKFSDSTKTILLVGTLLVAALGGLCAKRITQRFSIKKTIEATILLWVVLLASFALLTSPTLFTIVMLLNGFAFGLLFSASQALYTKLIPANQQASYFSFYTIFERASSFIGPLLWSLVLLVFSNYGNTRYRFAILSLAILVGISWFFVRKVEVSPENSPL